MSPDAVLLFLVPFALPLLMPSWRWLLVYVSAVTVLLIIWFAIWYNAFITTQTRTGLEAIGLVYILVPAVTTAAGTTVRLLALLIRARYGR
jgi:hypothetical protein